MLARDSDTNERFTVAGEVSSEPYSGQNLRIKGHWSHHPKFGKQFKMDTAIAMQPTTQKGMIRLLTRPEFKGVGETTAKAIVETFGLETIDILSENPEAMDQVKGIGLRARKKLSSMFSDVLGDYSAKAFLATHGFATGRSLRIIQHYGSNTIAALTENPYRLIYDIHGIGFRRADEFAKSLGFSDFSKERLEAGTVYVLKLAESDGHCYLNRSQLFARLADTLQLATEQFQDPIESILASLIESSKIIEEHVEESEDTRIYRRQTFFSEINITKAARQLLMNSPEVDEEKIDLAIREFKSKHSIELSDDQLDAVRSGARSSLFVLTGGPGVGKTTTANAMIFVSKFLGRTVELCAPTGRAAQRLSEVSGQGAKTIHRLLKWDPQTRGFEYGGFEDKKLKANTIISDEASMLDVHLAANLFKAVEHNAQLILIGDVDQLPSVGPGSVLGDLIDSGVVPFAHLKEVFRQALESNIIRSAHALNSGKTPEIGVDTDCKFIAAGDSHAIKETIVSLMTDVIPNKTEFDPLGDIQILTPMNKGPIGAEELNKNIRESLWPDRNASKQVFYSQGDKVIQTQNNYELKVFNGDIGTVENSSAKDKTLTVRYGERVVEYIGDSSYDLKYAYAITIHKSQGSEFPVVIIPISFSHRIMLQRNLIYTALTRARKLAIFVGDIKALSFASRTQTSNERQSFLMERLQGIQEAGLE